MNDPAYGADLARIHHEGFGDLARQAAVLLLGSLGSARGLVVDLGSGSGILARTLTDAGCDVLGVDLSAAMVLLASAHAPRARFVHASILDIEIPPCVAVTAVGEVLNYAFDPRTDLDRVGALLRRAHLALAPGGLLLFDVAGPGRAGPAGRREASTEAEEWTVRAVVDEDAVTATLVRDITLVADARLSHERHVLRLYRPDDVESALVGAGFSSVRRLDRYGSFDFPAGLTGFLAVA